MVLLLVGLKSIPVVYYEAASIDGAGAGRFSGASRSPS